MSKHVPHEQFLTRYREGIDEDLTMCAKVVDDVLKELGVSVSSLTPRQQSALRDKVVPAILAAYPAAKRQAADEIVSSLQGQAEALNARNASPESAGRSGAGQPFAG